MQSSVGKKRLCMLCLTHPRGWTQNVTRKSLFDPCGTKSSEEIKTLVTPVFNARVSWAKAPPAMMDGKVRGSQYSLFSSCMESFFRILVVCKLEREQKQSIVDFWVLPSLQFSCNETLLFSLSTQHTLSSLVTLLPRALPDTKCIIWLAPWFDKLNRISRCDWLPEQARWRCLARSGLPAAPHQKITFFVNIINPFLIELVRSRWLDNGLVFLVRVYGARLRLGA